MSTHHFHAVVWIDHREARLFEFNADDVQSLVIHAHGGRQVHHKAGAIGGGKSPEDTAFFKAVGAALHPVGEVLVVGPGAAKTQLVKWLAAHDHAAAEKIVAVESADHPTDGQIVAHARKYFERTDRMRPQH